MEQMSQEILLQLVGQQKEMIALLEEQIRLLKESMTRADEQANAMQQEIDFLRKQVEEKQAIIDSLTHKKNSSNSSTPPSTERFKKNKTESLREPSGKKPGGQPGHKGSGLKINKEPDKVREHLPERCQNCPHKDKCARKVIETRYEHEIEFKYTLIAHKLMGCCCELENGETITGAFPEGITGTQQYGNGVCSLVGSLVSVGYMAEDRVRILLNSLGIPISTGTVANIVERTAALLQPANAMIKAHMKGNDVNFFDETGIDIAGKLHWLHCACDELWRYYFIHQKRGWAAMSDMGILTDDADFIAVHDFWKPYFKCENVHHAMCNQHLERELVYTLEAGAQSWAGRLRQLLQEMCHKRKVLKACGKTSFTPEELEDFYRRYDALVQEGIDANPIPIPEEKKRGRRKKGKFLCLAERFRDYKTEILRFAEDWRVPFTNNIAEQAIRFVRVKEKVSGCFRTKRGADDFAQIMSYVSTAALHGVSCFDALKTALEGNSTGLVLAWNQPATE